MSPNPVGVNPKLPLRLEPGEAKQWLFHAKQLQTIVREQLTDDGFTDVRGLVRLATGEEVTTEEMGAEHIPMWEDRQAIAALLARARAKAKPPAR